MNKSTEPMIKPVWIKWLVTALTLVLYASFAPANASDTPPDEASKRILKKLKQVHPKITYGIVEQSHIKGLYKVPVEHGETLFVSEDGEYFILGEIFAITPNKFINLHDQEKANNRVKLMASLDQKDMIIYKPTGDTKATVYIFTDVDCPYCVKLHHEIPSMNDKGIEIRYLAYPRAGIYSPSFSKIAAAWCADNPKDALPRIQSGEYLDIEVCEDNPVEKHYNLGNKLGVSGTPTVILPNGSMFSGYRSTEEIVSLLKLK